MKLPQYVLEVGVLSRNEYDNYCLTFKKNPLKMSAHSFGEYMKEEMKKKVEKKKGKKKKKNYFKQAMVVMTMIDVLQETLSIEIPFSRESIGIFASRFNRDSSMYPIKSYKTFFQSTIYKNSMETNSR